MDKIILTVDFLAGTHLTQAIIQAKELAIILKDTPCKINLIPFNPFPQTRYETSYRKNIEKFGEILIKKGFVVVTRRTRGDDIDAACGQLVGKVADKTRREERKLKKEAQQVENVIKVKTID